jgi:hypothetical protein
MGVNVLWIDGSILALFKFKFFKTTYYEVEVQSITQLEFGIKVFKCLSSILAMFVYACEAKENIWISSNMKMPQPFVWIYWHFTSRW